MARLPGICRECGAVYPAPLRADDLSSDPAFEIPVPCPECGGSGGVPPGVLGRLTALLESAGPLREEPALVGRLAGALEEAALPPGGAEGEEERAVRRARLRARAGDIAGVGGELVDALFGLERGSVTAFVRLLRLATGEEGDDAHGEPADTVDGLLRRAYERWGPEQGEGEGVGEAARRLAAAGRNDPCPCGSGDKYKACHWLSDLRETR